MTTPAERPMSNFEKKILEVHGTPPLAAAREPVEGDIGLLCAKLSGTKDHLAKAYPAQLGVDAETLTEAIMLIRSLSARLTAPVPDVEGQVVRLHPIQGKPHSEEYVPADLARDLGRRLKEALDGR